MAINNNENFLPRSVSVCIPAYNEGKLIDRILNNILKVTSENITEILVCANGCTDDTAERVQLWHVKYPHIKLIELKKASKIAAWNTLIKNTTNELVIFLDADIQFPIFAFTELLNALEISDVVIAGGIQKPDPQKTTSWKRRLTGFIMKPLHQDYIYGGIYAFKKSALLSYFYNYGFSEMPQTIGEDIFLTVLIPKDKIKIVPTSVAYFLPPSFEDLMHYFARLQAQLKYLEIHYPELVKRFQKERCMDRNPLYIFYKKVQALKSLKLILIGSLAAIGKKLFLMIYHKRIEDIYQTILNGNTDPDDVIAHFTRDETTRQLL